MADYYSDKHYEGDKHKGHRARVRNKLKKNGLESFADYEKLEFLLFWCIPRRDTKDLAVELIDRFGSFNGVLSADENELRQIKNIGESTILFIQVLRQVAEIYMRNNIEHEYNFEDNKVVEKYLLDCLSKEKNERLFVFYLDAAYNLLNYNVYETADFNRVLVDEHKICRDGIVISANMILMAHNHPHGIAIPSQDDLDFTSLVDASAGAVGLRLLQHYIVTKDKCVPIMGL